MAEIYASPVFPKILNRKHATALSRALRKEGLRLERLIGSWSGGTGLLAEVWGECHDGEYVYGFTATWRFDEEKISQPAGQYYLATLEIDDDD